MPIIFFLFCLLFFISCNYIGQRIRDFFWARYPDNDSDNVSRASFFLFSMKCILAGIFFLAIVLFLGTMIYYLNYRFDVLMW